MSRLHRKTPGHKTNAARLTQKFVGKIVHLEKMNGFSLKGGGFVSEADTGSLKIDGTWTDISSIRVKVEKH